MQNIDWIYSTTWNLFWNPALYNSPYKIFITLRLEVIELESAAVKYSEYIKYLMYEITKK